ncbi:MAG: substrate-binding domain-containing protein, partial [Bacilli bacterium]
LNSLSAKQIDGVIIVGASIRNTEIEQSIIINIPIVSIDTKVNYNNVVARIRVDNYISSFKLVHDLIKKNYKSFGYIGGPQKSFVTIQRYSGFLDSLQDNNLLPIACEFGTYSIEFGYESIIKAKWLHKVDCIICGNDLIAIGVKNALDQLGIEIPSQISITGFDNISLTKALKPNITTIDQPAYKMGKVAVQQIIEYNHNGNESINITLNQEIKYRGTTR